ncbi:hypothetical protein [Olivibacter sitiensis]|uniref:hypothetical protein n=1 Tax=Olivibacter sitiensis TaxID=376470 RepID=UPI00041AE9F3|nr:hypothetical protein [Olivibacter sitiensis]
MKDNKLLQMNNVGIVVESLDAVIAFFTELGMKLEGRATILHPDIITQKNINSP